MTKLLAYFHIPLDVDEDSKVVVELATTYAVVKAMMPLRIGLSVYMAPWFARWVDMVYIVFLTRRFCVIPVTALFKRVKKA